MYSKKKTAFILDDSKEICDLLSTNLTLLNFNTHYASSYQEALQYLTTKFDVIIIDVILYGEEKSGLDFINEYIKKHPNTKIAVITAHQEQEIYNKVQETRHDLFVTKPFKIDSFCKKIFKLINGYTVKDEITFSSGDTERIEILKQEINDLKDDVTTFKKDISDIKIDNIQIHAKVDYIEKKIDSIDKSVLIIADSCSNTQGTVVTFIKDHSNDGIKIIGSIATIIVIALTALGLILKCNP